MQDSRNMIVVRYGEIGLKRKLRGRFEGLLVSNIQNVLKNEGYEAKLAREFGRIYILSSSERIAERVAKIFGVTSTSVAVETSSRLEDIVKKAVEVCRLDGSKSFAVRARRAGKHDFTSMDVERTVGAAIKEKMDARVDLKNPDVEIGIEVREKRTLIYTSTFKGFGGLPVGSQERVLSVLSDEKSYLSTWYALKRGCDVDLLVSENFLYFYKEFLPWACYREIGVKKSKSLGLKDMLCEAFKLSYRAVFCSITAEEVNEFIPLLRKRSMPVFTPLIHFDAEVIKRNVHELKKHFSLG